jgi:heptosyltransferase-2
LAENRFYAQAVRSIEYAALSSFFANGSELSSSLAEYFASFDLILSYLYDPDRIFETNLRRCGVENILRGSPKIENCGHAAEQLARPIEKLGIEVVDLAAKIFPSPEDHQFARDFLRELDDPIVFIHPGSGSTQKKWPLENWIALGDDIASLVTVSGEAEQIDRARLEDEWRDRRVLFAHGFPLPQLGAILANSIFVGHDSGISHLAAASGANCILLFGPTDPAVWAPRNENVRILRAPGGDLQRLEVDLVREALDQELMRIGIST